LWNQLGLKDENAKNLQVWDLRGFSRSLEKMVPPIVRRAKQMDGLSAIILDPIYKVITGDENKAEEMGKFCNFFDQIAEKCHCSMIYCHHHSKGSQGDKKAQDRASGSGVFARDPDALLVMIELIVDDNRRKAVTDRMVCDALGELMDKQSSIWRQMVPQDDQLKAASMIEVATTNCGEPAVTGIVNDITLRMKRATAWRFDGILREFPPVEPVNAWFIWPIHIVDDSGILSDVMADGQQKKGPSKRDRQDADIAELSLVFDSCQEDGQVSVDVVADRMKKTLKEVYDLARKSKVFKISKKVMRRKDEE
jgi:RecA-family ATPase